MRNVCVIAMALGLTMTMAGGHAFAKDRNHTFRGGLTEHQRDVVSHMSKRDRQYTRDHLAIANDGRAYVDPDRGPMPSSMANLNKMLNDKISFSVSIKQGSGISHLQLGKSSDSPDHSQGNNGRTSPK